MKFGMRPICIYGFLGLCLISLIFLGIQLIGVTVAFWMFMLYACILFLLFGTLFGNLNDCNGTYGACCRMASAIIGAACLYCHLFLPLLLGII
jgi:DHA1 family bicyclomycin/chloramphenicol resistance-like MFS transporter